jgi:succinyl-CoA synthetase alpha subunit
MGHAGAIISGGKGTAEEKFKVMRAAGIHIVDSPAALGQTVANALKMAGKANGNGNGTASKSTATAIEAPKAKAPAKPKAAKTTEKSATATKSTAKK